MVDHVARGISKLPFQFKDKQRVVDFLSVFLEELQEIEDCLEDIILQKDPNNAIGAQLDIIGEIVGVKRNAQSDIDYRQSILLQKAINSSKGQESLITTFWKEYTGTSTFSLTESFPAGVNLSTDAGTPPVEAIQKIKQVLAATVSLSATFSSGVPFTFEGVDGAGFSSVENPTIGGALVGTAIF